MGNQRKPQNACREQQSEPHFRDANPPSGIPATFRFVCESSDGKLCLFEDAQGHYTVVRAARLA